MSNYHDDHLEEMEDDHDMDDPADYMVDEQYEREVRDSDSEDGDHDQLVRFLLFLLSIAFAIKSIPSF